MIGSMKLLDEIKSCQLCANELPLAPKPILQFHPKSEFLIIGQAPGIKAHESGIPWNDASGVRLRQWLNIHDQDFYNPRKFSIVPMGFCYPGKGKSGDLPPRKECSTRWMDTILCHLKNVKSIILVGNYSAAYFLGEGKLSDKIMEHSKIDSSFIVLPHPSPRNNIWLRKNEWFEYECLPSIRRKLYR